MILERMWIDQPSTAQPLHKYNGKNVLFDRKEEIIYFTEGSIHSMQLWPLNALSTGWRCLPQSFDFCQCIARKIKVLFILKKSKEKGIPSVAEISDLIKKEMG